MKQFWLAALAVCSALSGFAQVQDQQTAKAAAFSAAKAMDEALINRRYDDYVNYNHPKVLAQVPGGKPEMAAQISKQMIQIQESGNTITAVWPSPPDVVIDTAGEWQAALQQFMTYRLPEGKIKAVTTIIGISPDEGKQWYFVDAAGRTLEQMRELFPTLSSKIKIAKPTDPEFIPDNPTPAPPAKPAAAPKAAPAKKK